MHLTEIDPEDCCELKLAIPSTDDVIAKGLGEKIKALKISENRLDASVPPKAAVVTDPGKPPDREEVAKVGNPAKVPKTKDTAEQPLSSPTTLETQTLPFETTTPPVNQSSVQRKGEIKPTSTKLSKAKAAGATEVAPELPTQGLNAQSPYGPRAEPHKKKKKKNVGGGGNLVAKAKPKKSQDRKMEKENVDCKGKAKSQASLDSNLPTIPERPVAGGTKKKKKQNKVKPAKVRGIALTTKISSQRKEVDNSKEIENQPGKSTRPHTSAK
ncbi:hypothetical protein CGCTS75_v000467 [Colletotrichum tropicale]|nr:hypothetical protein CGCTS75_v000467 [Colletotrichum tropicale]